MARRLPADDAKAANRLFPQDRHSRSHPHHSAGPTPHNDGDNLPPRRSHIERITPGSDPSEAIGRLYSEGRHHPYAKPHDYTRRGGEPGYTTPVPTRDEHYSHFHQHTRDERITPAYSEQAPQAPSDKHGATYDNDASGWVRGKGSEAPHPFFDHGLSGERYRK